METAGFATVGSLSRSFLGALLMVLQCSTLMWWASSTCSVASRTGCITTAVTSTPALAATTTSGAVQRKTLTLASKFSRSCKT